jgi:hypothetical protein
LLEQGYYKCKSFSLATTMTKYTFPLLCLYFLFSVNTTHAETKKIKLAGPAAVISYPLMVMATQQKVQN